MPSGGFKGLDLIDRVPDELWMEVRDIVHETGWFGALPGAFGLGRAQPQRRGTSP